MFIANIFVVILIYALISSTLTIDKDVLYHVYILSVLYENNCEMFVILTILLSCEALHLQRKKNYLDICMKRKMIDNKYNLYHIYEFKIIVYDMKLK